jgi:hypothetical protein
MLQLQHLRASRKAQRVAFVMGRLLLCDGGSNILCFVKPTSPRCLSIFSHLEKYFTQYTIQRQVFLSVNKILMHGERQSNTKSSKENFLHFVS